MKSTWNRLGKEKKLLKSKIIENLFYKILGLIIFFILWQMVGWIILELKTTQGFEGFLPIPTCKALLSLLTQSNFWISILMSLKRILLGLLFATVIGIPIGLLLGLSLRWRMITEIPINFLRMISPLSWMPIAVLIFPTFDNAIVFLLTMACIWPLLLNTTQGVIHTEQQWLDMAINQGANTFQLVTKIMLPHSVPYILTGLRLSLGIGWIILVPAEFLGVSYGLGYLINDARDIMQYDQLMGIVIAIGMIGFMMDHLVRLLQKRYDWRIRYHQST